MRLCTTPDCILPFIQNRDLEEKRNKRKKTTYEFRVQGSLFAQFFKLSEVPLNPKVCEEPPSSKS